MRRSAYWIPLRSSVLERARDLREKSLSRTSRDVATKDGVFPKVVDLSPSLEERVGVLGPHGTKLVACQELILLEALHNAARQAFPQVSRPR